MLMYLIAVLVLLAIGFYALSVGVTGHISVGEGPELTAPTRLLVIGIAVIAFGAAYLVYKQPRDGDDGVPSIPATASSPPESRGSAPMAAAEVASEAARPDPGAEAEAAVADEEEEMPEAAPAPSETAKAAAEPEPVKAAAAAEPATASSEGLSSAAAALEARSRQRRMVATPVVAVAAAVPEEALEDEVVEAAPQRSATLSTSTASSAKTTPTRAGSSREPRTRRTTRVYRSEPLLLHVHNSLGRGQSREQLTLLIEGKPVAEIDVDDSQPEISVAIELPRPGLLHYRLEGISEDRRTTRVVGEGCIRVTDGMRYAVRRKDGSRKVFLEAAGQSG